MTTAKANMSGAIGAATVAIPHSTRAKGWHVAARPVRYYGGETAETAAAFAADILATFEAHHAAELERPVGCGYDATLLPLDRVTFERRYDKAPTIPARGSRPMPAPDASLAALVARHAASDPAERRANLARLVARVTAERAEIADRALAADVARVLANSGPTGAEIIARAHSAERAAAREPITDYNYAEDRAETAEPEPAAGAIGSAEHLAASFAGFAADMLSSGRRLGILAPETAEPEPEPVDDRGIAYGAMTQGEYAAARHAAINAPVAAPEPEPAPEPVAAPETAPAPVAAPEPVAEPAPSLAAVPEPVAPGRPTCERCGQSFRKSGAGLAWHVANRPDCAAGRLSVVA